MSAASVASIHFSALCWENFLQKCNSTNKTTINSSTVSWQESGTFKVKYITSNIWLDVEWDVSIPPWLYQNCSSLQHILRGDRERARSFRALGACLWQTSVRYCLCLALSSMKNWWSSLQWCYHRAREESEHGKKTKKQHLCLSAYSVQSSHHLVEPSISFSHRVQLLHASVATVCAWMEETNIN